MAGLIMRPSQAFVECHKIAARTVEVAYTHNTDHKERIRASLEKIRQLCDELDLLPQQAVELWKTHELWPMA